MGDPEKVALDDDTAREIARRARAAGVPLDDYVRRRVLGPSSESGGFTDLLRQQMANPGRRSPAEQMEVMTSMMMNMALIRGMGGSGFLGESGGRERDSLTREDIERIIERQLGNSGGGRGSRFKDMGDAMIEMRMLDKLMKSTDDPDSPMSKLMESRMKEIQDELKGVRGDAASEKERRQKEELDAAEARHRAEREALEDRLDQLQAFVTQRQASPDPAESPSQRLKSSVDDLVMLQQALDGLRRGLAPPAPGEAPKSDLDVDKLLKLADGASTIASRMMTSGAQAAAISKGASPPVLHSPGGPPQPPPGPAYTEDPPPPPGSPPPRQAPPGPPPGAFGKPPVDPLANLPKGSTFLDPDSGEPIPESVFRERYGDAIRSGQMSVEVMDPGPAPPPGAVGGHSPPPAPVEGPAAPE